MTPRPAEASRRTGCARPLREPKRRFGGVEALLGQRALLEQVRRAIEFEFGVGQSGFRLLEPDARATATAASAASVCASSSRRSCIATAGPGETRRRCRPVTRCSVPDILGITATRLRGETLPGIVRDARRSPCSSLSISGSLSARSRVAVIPKMSGTLRRVLVDIGDHVGEGQVVAVAGHDASWTHSSTPPRPPSPSPYASLEQAEAALANAQLEFDRAKNLFEKGALAKQRLDAADTALRVLECSSAASHRGDAPAG